MRRILDIMSKRTIRKVVTTASDWQQAYLDTAKRLGRSDINFVFTKDHDDYLREVVDANVLIAGLLNPQVLDAAEQLLWIAANSGGVEGILSDALLKKQVPLTCLKPIFGPAGAEHALAAMFFFAKRFYRTVEPVPFTQWESGYDDTFKPAELEGKTVGIIGLGAMGTALAKKADGLDMRVLALTRTPRSAPEHVYQAFTADQRAQVLGQSDYIVIALPSTPLTRSMIGETFLREMSQTAYLIDCTGRYALFDYHALEIAILQGWIAGVSLEPGGPSPDQYLPPLDAPFWQHENVSVSPCRATSTELKQKAIALFFDNLQRFENDQPLLGLVDQQAGY